MAVFLFALFAIHLASFATHSSCRGIEVVAGEDGIHRRICHRRHVGHGADDIRGDTRVDVQAQFVPLGGVEAARGLVFVLGAAADVEEGGHGYHALGWNALSFNSRIVSPEGASTKSPLR